MKRFVNLPPASNISKALDNGVARDCMLVYEMADDSKGYILREICDPKEEYGEECIIVPINSVYYKHVNWPSGHIFANVLESSGDRGYYAGRYYRWKDLFDIFGLEWSMCEENQVYDCVTENLVPGTAPGPSDIVVGGHVISKCMPQKVRKGDCVCIAPISKKHNSINVPHMFPQTKGNGNGFFMKTARAVDVLVMTGYLCKNYVDSYR